MLCLVEWAESLGFEFELHDDDEKPIVVRMPNDFSNPVDLRGLNPIRFAQALAKLITRENVEDIESELKARRDLTFKGGPLDGVRHGIGNYQRFHLHHARRGEWHAYARLEPRHGSCPLEYVGPATSERKARDLATESIRTGERRDERPNLRIYVG